MSIGRHHATLHLLTRRRVAWTPGRGVRYQSGHNLDARDHGQIHPLPAKATGVVRAPLKCAAEQPPRKVTTAMPTVLRVGPYRFFFYSGDGNEPPHIHVERDDRTAKIWLDPVRMDRSSGYPAKELREVERLVTEHQMTLTEAWNEFFGS